MASESRFTVSKIFKQSSIPTTPIVIKHYNAKRKQTIPKAVREQLWIRDMGRVFESKCKVTWCQNRINVFDFQCGHNIPESKGGKMALENLIAICSRCNMSMGDRYTIDEWSALHSNSITENRITENRITENRISRYWCWPNLVKN